MISDIDLCALAAASYHIDATWKTDTAHVCRTDFPDFTVITARGSLSFQDFVTDARDMPCRSHPQLGATPEGFLASAESVFDAIMREVPGPYVLVGHSLGGAQVQEMAALATLAGRPPLLLTTFGAPRVGALGNLIAGVAGADYRNKRDPVPAVPILPVFYEYPRPAARRSIGTPSLLDCLDPIHDHFLVQYATSLAALPTVAAA